MSQADAPRVHVETVEEWRTWLAEHHRSDTCVWLVTWRSPTGRPAPSYEQQIEEALCVGWVDSTAKKLDEERSMLYFAARRPGSGWARTNKARIARLEAEGRLLPAGQAVVERARADGSWTLLDDVEALVVPADLAAALGRTEGGRAGWDALSPSIRKQILTSLVQAKRPETRAARIAESVDRLSGERPRMHYRVRDAHADDADALGRVHVRAWQGAYRGGLMPDAYLDALSEAERASMWREALADGPRPRASRLVVESEDRSVVGFAIVGPAGGEVDAVVGELYAINVEPDHWGTGAGRRLFDAGVDALRAVGFTSAVLWVHPLNNRARRFYETAGWSSDGIERQQDVLGVEVPETRYSVLL